MKHRPPESARAHAMLPSAIANEAQQSAPDTPANAHATRLLRMPAAKREAQREAVANVRLKENATSDAPSAGG
eukprot:CAMPEP_0119409148 /NCGR_PEP_ID=MMETSP1335-20130426/2507_1 /TAXON_ID=259385 /ORGANISM="Chrysoculter rhomboideus, Strain RCC1486" /LENGTH=72 /DNA_ID=CAMNT_0007433479 /DNA_START=100 /DNA_END=317 /DNA_ORIENTATION=+